MSTDPIVVLGGHGLAGRAIVAGLLTTTRYPVTALGRNPERLHRLHESLDTHRLATQVLDAADMDKLRAVCADAALVINAIGPYAKHGANIARVVVETGRPYIDCANEQIHYHRLEQLHETAKANRVPMVTAAGAIPGVSGLVAARLIQRFPKAHRVDCYWAQYRNVDEKSGAGSLLSGILEAGHHPVAMADGRPEPVVLGRSLTNIELPPPFGQQQVLEVPTIECLTLPNVLDVRNVHSWFYFGDMPLWIFELIRVLKPHRRNWAFRLVDQLTRRVNEPEVAKAILEGRGPEGLLLVTARDDGRTESAHILFKDGATATAALPIQIADGLLRRRWDQTGLLTPLDLFDPDDALDTLGDAVTRRG